LRCYKRISDTPLDPTHSRKFVGMVNVLTTKNIYPYELRSKPVNGLPYCDGGWPDDDDIW
jgi:hypothetical protein